MRLASKIGIVTAAASGMGRAGALRFAREGAQVAVVDVDAAGVKRVVDEITAAGGTAHGIAGRPHQGRGLAPHRVGSGEPASRVSTSCGTTSATQDRPP